VGGNVVLDAGVGIVCTEDMVSWSLSGKLRCRGCGGGSSVWVGIQTILLPLIIKVEDSMKSLDDLQARIGKGATS
jgi:hypothetical protein